MARYIDGDRLRELIASFTGMFTDEGFVIDYHAVLRAIDNAPTVDNVPKSEDMVSIRMLKKWLYSIAINNVGCVFDGDFSDACGEIISRLDGLKRYAKDMESEGNDREYGRDSNIQPSS